MRRLLEANGVTFIRSNRAIVVPLSEIRSHAPVVWNSLTGLESLRSHAARLQTANANKSPASRSKGTASRTEHTAFDSQLPASSSSHAATSGGNTDEDPERSAQNDRQAPCRLELPAWRSERTARRPSYTT
jgi:hypothetical protein